MNIPPRLNRQNLLPFLLLSLLAAAPGNASADSDGAMGLYERQRLQRAGEVRRLGRAMDGRPASPDARRVLRQGLQDLQTPVTRPPELADRQRLERELERQPLRPVLDDWARPTTPDPTPDPLQTPSTPPPWIVLPRHTEGSH